VSCASFSSLVSGLLRRIRRDPSCCAGTNFSLVGRRGRLLRFRDAG
jgi:hypothetical protein